MLINRSILLSRLSRCAMQMLVMLGLLCVGFTANAQNTLIYAYSLGNNHLISFSANTPGTLLSDVALSGLAAGEYVAGIDFRPATGELYGVIVNATDGRVAKINAQTGAVTPVGATTVPLNYSDFVGVGFNPVTDRLRVVSSSGTNLRIDPNTATVTVDTGLSYVAGDANVGTAPRVSHVAYTNSFRGAPATSMYGIDYGLNVLVIAPSPDDGQLATVGPLGVDALEFGGFDIQAGTGIAYAAMKVGAYNSLYSINLISGTATLVGTIGIDGLIDIDGLAVAAPPSPCLDLDGDGIVNPLTDGLMLLRAMLGMTGTAVTNGAMPVSAPPRSSWAAIQAHMNANCGMRFGP